MTALQVEHIRHAFGSLIAVDDLSLAIEDGEIVCVLGPSGCGKTTLLRIAAGLEALQQGRVLLNDEVVADAKVEIPPESRSVGLVFQDYALFPHLNVLDNVVFGLRNLPSRERRERGLAALELVGMAGQRGVYPHTLSGGQQQRVALARALAPKPRVMLLDEPFSGLDAQLRHRVRDQTLHILKESGTASLVVTHDPEEAMFMADRIALMRDGRIEQLGPPSALYYRPANAFVAGFFGEINRLQAVTAGEQVETALGPLAADGLPDGTAVEVLIRPEAIKLAPLEAVPADGSGYAMVMAARLLGRTSLVHLNVVNGSIEPLHLHARVPGAFLPPENAPLKIELDRSQTFVFARESEEAAAPPATVAG